MTQFGFRTHFSYLFRLKSWLKLLKNRLWNQTDFIWSAGFGTNFQQMSQNPWNPVSSVNSGYDCTAPTLSDVVRIRQHKMLLLLLSRFSRVRLWATPETAAHQAPRSLGCSKQEHWSGLPFPSPMHESEKWKWSRSVVSDSQWPYGLQPTRLLHPWDFPGKSTGVGSHRLLHWKQLLN